MKKFNYLFLISLIFGISLFSCKSAPSVTGIPVKAIDLLDDKGAMYIHIPKKNNEQLLSSFIQGFYKELDKSSADLVVANLDDVYASLGGIKNRKRFQVSASGNVPKVFSSALKKNGFTQNSYTAKSVLNNTAVYNYFDNSTLQIANPSSDLLSISQDVRIMLDLYNKEKEILNTPNLEVDDSVSNVSWKQSDLYNWISNTDTGINFYIVRPQAFLTNLIGSAISTKLFKLVYAKGKFNKLDETYYGLDLELEFTNPSFVKPAVSILILTLGLTDSEVMTTTNTHVVVKGVRVNTKQLINMLGL